jgi:hypothetical protein
MRRRGGPLLVFDQPVPSVAPLPPAPLAQFYLKRVTAFGLPPAGKTAARLSWSQIQEAARARGQIAVGIAPFAGGPDAIVMAPGAGEEFWLSEADELVVISRD